MGGPNGAGKTTIARRVLADTLGITEFVNADTIAQGLSGFEPERAALAAGRVMLARLRALGSSGRSFAFESTLASRTFHPWLRDLKGRGYEVHLVYVALSTPELAIDRVRARVARGGHNVPEPVIRRRFIRSLKNLFELYIPLADTWRIVDNSTRSLRIIAQRRSASSPEICDRAALIHLNHVASNTPNPSTDTGRDA